jgi:hypothetical protein
MMLCCAIVCVCIDVALRIYCSNCVCKISPLRAPDLSIQLAKFGYVVCWSVQTNATNNHKGDLTQLTTENSLG